MLAEAIDVILATFSFPAFLFHPWSHVFPFLSTVWHFSIHSLMFFPFCICSFFILSELFFLFISLPYVLLVSYILLLKVSINIFTACSWLILISSYIVFLPLYITFYFYMYFVLSVSLFLLFPFAVLSSHSSWQFFFLHLCSGTASHFSFDCLRHRQYWPAHEWRVVRSSLD